MELRIDAVSWPLWLAQTLAITFLVAGFNTLDMYLWRKAHLTAGRGGNGYRLALIIVPLLIGLNMLYVGHASLGGNIEITNVGLFILTLPLFDERLKPSEGVVRLVCVGLVWLALHRDALLAPTTLVGTVILLALLWALWKTPATFRYRPWATMLAAGTLGALFWLTVPWTHLHIYMSGMVFVQAIGMYLVMGAYCAFYWVATHAQFESQARVSKLDAYGRETDKRSYRYSQEDADKLMAASQRHNRPLTIATLDVDNYTTFNREHGHMAGNEVLIEVAELLEKALERFDPRPHIYRSGGEEFNIAFPDTDTSHAVDAIRLCLFRVREHDFKVGDGTAKLTLSAGITGLAPDDLSIDDLFKRADDNLRLSKRRGRDMYTVDGESSAAVQEPEHLAFFAQPINHVTADAVTLCCNELLLRTYDKRNQRWTLPKRFDISVVEQIALIRQVLAVSDCQNVTINLTLAQFCDPETTKALTWFATADLGPKKLTVEIIDVPDLGTMRRITAMYRDANINVLIDDVGSDNSFELVQKLLPYVDGVKFAIQNLRKTESFDRIKERIQFWVGIADQHQIKFILEGVEDADEVAFAQALGVTYFQGYYYGKPALPGK